MLTAIKSNKRLRKLLLLSVALLSCGDLSGEEKRAVTSPDWLKGSVIYEVSLRSFSNDAKFFTLEEHMLKLKNWGADAFCLAPVFSIGEEKNLGSLGDARAVKDFSAINYEFGTKDAFKSLVQQAHYSGLKVILTWVADTTSKEHAWIKNNPDWYVKNSSGGIAEAEGHPDLALLDLSNPNLQDEFIKLLLQWATDFDLDGFNCESIGAPNLEFWVKARKALVKSRKNFVLLTDSDLPENHQAAFDLTPSVKSHNFLASLISDEGKIENLELFFKEEENSYPRGSLLARYMETLYSGPARKSFGPAQRAAAVFNASIPGIMWIVAGEEAGASRILGRQEKLAIDWKKANKDLTKFYKTLLKFRRAHPAMSRGQVFQAPVPEDGKILAYTRTYRNDAVLVVINFSDREWKGSLVVPDIFKSEKGAVKLKPALSGVNFSASILTLPAFGYQIFTAD